ARDALLKEAPPIDEAQDYYSLLAGLQHQLGEFQAASVVYRDLLATNNREGTWWLGLAVSLDSLGEKANALAAFQMANQYEQKSIKTRTYIEQRILALR